MLSRAFIAQLYNIAPPHLSILAPSPLLLPSWLKFTLPVVRLPSQRLFISRRAARTPPLRHSAQRQIHFIGNADRIQSELEPNQVFSLLCARFKVVRYGWLSFIRVEISYAISGSLTVQLPQAGRVLNLTPSGVLTTRGDMISFNKMLNILLTRINKQY